MGRKKLYRSRQQRVIGGVCGGIAEYFDIDPILVRLGFILFFFADGAGLLAYIIAWIIIPENSTFEEDTIDVNNSSSDNDSGKHKTLGIILIVLGAFLLLNRVIPQLYIRHLWPLFLVGLGIVLIVKEVRDNG